jgi:hypothetical protein
LIFNLRLNAVIFFYLKTKLKYGSIAKRVNLHVKVRKYGKSNIQFEIIF